MTSAILVQCPNPPHLWSAVPYLHICPAVDYTQAGKCIGRSHPSSDRFQAHISQDPEHIHWYLQTKQSRREASAGMISIKQHKLVKGTGVKPEKAHSSWRATKVSQGESNCFKSFPKCAIQPMSFYLPQTKYSKKNVVCERGFKRYLKDSANLPLERYSELNIMNHSYYV